MTIIRVKTGLCPFLFTLKGKDETFPDEKQTKQKRKKTNTLMYIIYIGYRQNVYLFYTRKVLETFEINCEEVRQFLRRSGPLVY